MITRRELIEAIEDCEAAPMSYQNCQKLATFYSLYDHLFAEPSRGGQAVFETVVDVRGESDFLNRVNGVSAARAWAVMDELMEAVKVLNPRMYDGVMRRLGDG